MCKYPSIAPAYDDGYTFCHALAWECWAQLSGWSHYGKSSRRRLFLALERSLADPFSSLPDFSLFWVLSQSKGQKCAAVAPQGNLFAFTMCVQKEVFNKTSIPTLEAYIMCVVWLASCVLGSRQQLDKVVHTWNPSLANWSRATFSLRQPGLCIEILSKQELWYLQYFAAKHSCTVFFP